MGESQCETLFKKTYYLDSILLKLLCMKLYQRKISMSESSNYNLNIPGSLFCTTQTKKKTIQKLLKWHVKFLKR